MIIIIFFFNLQDMFQKYMLKLNTNLNIESVTNCFFF